MLWDCRCTEGCIMPREVKNKVAASDTAVVALIKRELAKREKAGGSAAKQQEWKVEGVPGLSLALKPSGVAIYYVRFMAGHGARRKQIRQAIGQANGPTAIGLPKARTQAIKIASEGPTGFGDDGSPKVTLRQLFDQF